jgi:hypothetical protein
MAINLKGVKVNVPRANVEDYVFTIYGRPKAGKTTLFANMVEKAYGSVDKGLLIAFEEGYNALKVVAQPVNDFNDFVDVCDQLVEQKDELGFKMVGVDTIDEMYKSCVNYMLKREGRKDQKKYQALNDIPWGKGHEYVDVEIVTQLVRLKKAGYGLFFITHDKDKKFESRDGVSYDKTTCSLPERIRNTILNMSDFINFIDIAKEKDVVTGKLMDRRYIYFRANGADLEAGSRFANVPEKVEYNAKLFLQTFETAILSEFGDSKKVEQAKIEQAKQKEETAKEYIKSEKEPTNDELVNEIKDKFIKAGDPAKLEMQKYMSDNGISSFANPDEIAKEHLLKIVAILS